MATMIVDGLRLYRCLGRAQACKTPVSSTYSSPGGLETRTDVKATSGRRKRNSETFRSRAVVGKWETRNIREFQRSKVLFVATATYPYDAPHFRRQGLLHKCYRTVPCAARLTPSAETIA